jgi:hypothetical protein
MRFSPQDFSSIIEMLHSIIMEHRSQHLKNENLWQAIFSSGKQSEKGKDESVPHMIFSESLLRETRNITSLV